MQQCYLDLVVCVNQSYHILNLLDNEKSLWIKFLLGGHHAVFQNLFIP